MTTARTLHHLDGKYRVVAQLDHGEVKDVFLGIARGEADFNRLVVLKALRPNLRYEREFTEMFLTEARLAARLAHPNVVETYEVFEFEGLPVIVMEYLEGETLSHLLARKAPGRLGLELQLHVLLDALSGLHYSHELTDFDGTQLSVVHRDVSPQNLFVTREGRTKILDFGIAKLDSSTVQTASGIIKGKLRYLAPEQLAGGTLDRRVDVFAMGVLLWEAAVGRKMWEGTPEPQILKALGSGAIPTPRSVAPDLDPRLERIVLRALAPHPAQRFPTALALKLELEAFLDDADLRATDAQVARAVESLLGPQLDERRNLIERQAERVSLLTPAEMESFAPPALAPAPTQEATASRVNRFRAPPRAPRLLALALGLLTLANLGLLFAWWPESTADSSPPLSSVPVDPPAEIRVRITVFPVNAQISVDGEAVTQNPYLARYPVGGALTVRAEAPGFLSKEESLPRDRDRDLVLVLEHAAPGALPGPTGSAPARTPSPPAKPPEAKPTAGSTEDARAPDTCTPPYVLDAQGVKRFKRECLD